MKPNLHIIGRDHPLYPERLTIRLGDEAPQTLRAIGSLELIGLEKIALFCSRKCPGDAILAAMDEVQG